MEIKMSFSIKFNDHELCDYLRVVSIRRNIGTTRTNNTVKSGNRAGQIFTSMTRDMATIEVEFKMKNNLIEKRRELAAILNVTEPAVLILGDEPSKYYKAIPDGDISPEDQNFLSSVTLQFVVPDGLAHAVDTKEFGITETEDDERIFHIVNNGTAPARVNFNLEATQDVDSFALITGDDDDDNSGQIIQIGDEDDPEITEQDPQTYLWKGRMKSNQKSNWKENIATPNYLRDRGDDLRSRVDGNVEWRSPQSVGPSTYGDYADDMRYWHGPSITRHMNQLVDNFILHTRFHMRVTPESLKGKKRLEAQEIIEFNVYDNDDQLVIGANFKDKWAKEKTIQITVYLANIVVYKGDVPLKLISQTKRFAGWITFQKIGNQFTVRISKSHNGKQQWSLNFDRTNEAAGRLQASRVDYWFGRKGARRPYRLDIARSNFKILNTEDEADIPNHINEDDEILIDGQESKVYINEALSPEYLILGSQFIEVPPGETDIYVVDDGALTGTASIEEVYV